MSKLGYILWAVLSAGFVFTCVLVINHQTHMTARMHEAELSIRRNQANIINLYELLQNNSAMDEKRLLDLKQQIDDAKLEVSQLKGRRANLMEQLQEQWGCKTVKEAEAKLEKMRQETTQLEAQLKKGIQQLEDEYEFE